MHSADADDLLEADLVELIWEAFGAIEDQKAAQAAARQFIRHTADRGGLLEEESNRYGFFTHRTF
jgi:hypothetical protein